MDNNILIPIDVVIKFFKFNNLFNEIATNIKVERNITGPISQKYVGDAYVETLQHNGPEEYLGGQKIKIKKYEFSYKCSDKYYFKNNIIHSSEFIISGESVLPDYDYDLKLHSSDTTSWYNIESNQTLEFYLENNEIILKYTLDKPDKKNKKGQIDINSVEDLLNKIPKYLNIICRYYKIEQIEILRFYKTLIEQQYQQDIEKINNEISMVQQYKYNEIKYIK